MPAVVVEVAEECVPPCWGYCPYHLDKQLEDMTRLNLPVQLRVPHHQRNVAEHDKWHMVNWRQRPSPLAATSSTLAWWTGFVVDEACVSPPPLLVDHVFLMSSNPLSHQLIHLTIPLENLQISLDWRLASVEEVGDRRMLAGPWILPLSEPIKKTIISNIQSMSFIAYLLIDYPLMEQKLVFRPACSHFLFWMIITVIITAVIWLLSSAGTPFGQLDTGRKFLLLFIILSLHGDGMNKVKQRNLLADYYAVTFSRMTLFIVTKAS